ncbi:hypothetical protein X798_07618 [Onchocerca flexuosa]|uniref:Uncharacterized protein n=1 Tax=Onchocerca flexuosa TaxID=387005 RepID=A0A238BIX5_9BILA|nr:hypothetical protein X798_07618 [Onchocerca flexuosa]
MKCSSTSRKDIKNLKQMQFAQYQLAQIFPVERFWKNCAKKKNARTKISSLSYISDCFYKLMELIKR